MLVQLSPLPAAIRRRVGRVFALPMTVGKIHFKLGWVIVAQCIIYLMSKKTPQLVQYNHLNHFTKPEEEEMIEAHHNRLRKKWLH